jgi:genome maintenance exonuclease 1
MHINEKYQYSDVIRVTEPNGYRHYICPVTGKHLPSVTTILSQTADKSFLNEWRQRVGNEKAEQIKKEALGLGTLMHTHLENHILGKPRPGGNNLVRVMAERMADTIIARGLVNVDEVYGSEVVLYYPELFAGTSDLVGVYQGKEAIMDFKTARKMRTDEQIEDYKLQTCAYMQAHNEIHGTDIRTGVIFMVDRDYNYQEFLVEESEVDHYTMRWLDRLQQFLFGADDGHAAAI